MLVTSSSHYKSIVLPLLRRITTRSSDVATRFAGASVIIIVKLAKFMGQ